jgi:hypothetical protein
MRVGLFFCGGTKALTFFLGHFLEEFVDSVRCGISAATCVFSPY